MRVAIYGKGGIGKSTVSANLTAALSVRGLKVLQIGCDPKHDSTRLLLNGRDPPTVMEYIRSTSKGERDLSDVIVQGYGGSLCVEAGGPEPGVGCAGRGILSTFDLLEELGVDSLDADVTLYDVLGDVVCGGFAVPLRNDYAQKVMVVTSGEFMSIYAANNILRGVRNYDPRRMGGIIFNSRGDDEERERVRAFAEAVGLPVVAEIPRSTLFLEAERTGATVVELFPDDPLSSRFHDLANTVLDGEVHEARPLGDEELERIVLGKASAPRAEAGGMRVENGSLRPRTPPVYTSRNVDRHEVLHGCAFTGAVVTCMSVEGLHTVMHSPDSCAHLSCQMAQNAARRAFLKEGVSIPSFLEPRVHCSSMDDPAMVFGGTPLLEAALRRALAECSHVAMVTSCPSGIIGDDVISLAQRMEAEHEGSKVITMVEDGNVAGDHMQGVIDACVALADSLITEHPPRNDLINVVGIKPIATNNERNMRYLESVLSMMGMGLNCRFIGGTDIDSIEGFKKASLSILANTDRFAQMLASFLEDEHGARFLRSPLSAGMAGTEAWIRELALHGGTQDADKVIEGLRHEYQEALGPLRNDMEGRSVCIISMHKDIDWLIDLIDDLGMELRRAYVVDRSDHLMDYHVGNRHESRLMFLQDYVMEDVVRSCVQESPDILLSTYPVDAGLDIVQERIPMVPDIGHLAPLELARHWALALRAPLREGWRVDHDG